MRKFIEACSKVGETKTYKREMALVVFIWLAYVTETKDVEILKVISYPAFLFISLAFGLDVYGKLRDRPEPSEFSGGRRYESGGEHTTGEDEQSDPRNNY